MLTISSREAHLWYADPTEVGAPDGPSRARAVLTDDERARLDAFVFADDRQTFLATRVLVRTVLSRYAPVAPDAWRFRSNAYGRPEIANIRSHLRFNLANTRGLVVCAVTADVDIGVDVERVDRPAPLDVADQYFAPSEIAALHALPLEQRAERFFELWTLKESYIKARGLGLAIPLDQFSFHLEADRDPRIEMDPRLRDADSWQFAQLHPTSSHVVALCVRRQTAASVRIETRRAAMTM